MCNLKAYKTETRCPRGTRLKGVPGFTALEP